MLGRARVVVGGFVLAWAMLGAGGCAKSDNGVGFGGAAATGGFSALGGASSGGFAGSQAGAGGFAGQASGGASGSASGGASGSTGTGGATGGTGGATGGTGGATGGTGGATGGSGGTGGTTSGTAWINELHYDNASTDVNEGVEIAGTAGLNLTNWSLVFYNGAAGQLKSYMTKTLSGSIPSQQNGMGTVWFAVAAIQNGGADGTTTDPDGVALVDAANKVVQFLSYEGAFTPIDGPAAGMASVDIGKAELSTSPVGDSLQLVGSGKTYASFSWADSMAATPGQPNTGQTF